MHGRLGVGCGGDAVGFEACPGQGRAGQLSQAFIVFNQKQAHATGRTTLPLAVLCLAVPCPGWACVTSLTDQTKLTGEQQHAFHHQAGAEA